MDQYDEAMPQRTSCIVIIIVVLWLVGSIDGGTQPIVTTDLLRIRSAPSIDVSRDGLRAVFAVRSIGTLPPANPSAPASDPASGPSYKYQSHLYLLDLSEPAAVPRQLTFGERNDGAPKLSPDGKRIAFVRNVEPKPSAMLRPHQHDDNGESSAQVWIIPTDGGEARQVTAFKHGCDSPQWAPDGSRLLVSAAIPIDELEGSPTWPMERPKREWKDAPPAQAGAELVPRPDGTRAEIRAWLERNASHLNPNVITRLEFQDETSLHGLMRFTHLFLLDPSATGQAPIEHTAARRITSGFFDHREAAFMPDGQSIVYSSKKPRDQHLDRVLATTLWRINIDGANDREILALDGWTLGSPKPSRDGAAIAFLGQRMDEPAFRQTQLGLISSREEAAQPSWLTDEMNLASSVDSFEWMQAQPAIIFNCAMRGGFPLMTVSPGLVQPATLVGQRDGLPVGVQAFAAGGGSVVYTLTSVTNPCTLHVRDGRGDRLAYDLNPWVADKTLSLPVGGEVSRGGGPDGLTVQYWLMEPTNREPGRKYPLVLEMHGGPSAMWGPGEFTLWHEFQLLCSWGFGVVYSNPRGSGGYGYTFQKANFQDWGEGPAGDVLAALDHVLVAGAGGGGGDAGGAAEWIDKERLVITGGSYAGYLTAWIIAHDHRFKAAVAQRGVYDFDTFYGEGNAWRLIAWAMGGSPLDARAHQTLDRNNAFNFVSRIKTPLLITHASNDLRTGVSQSEMMYRALKELGRPVEYVRYPDEGHDLSRTGDPLRRMDRLSRIIEFFERYVENPRAAPTVSGS